MFFGRQTGIGPQALAALAAALVLIAVFNGLDRRAVELPVDGATWVDSDAGVIAAQVAPESPAAQVGVRPGDLLLAINEHAVETAADSARNLAEVGPWNRADYRLSRDGKRYSVNLVVAGERPRPARGVFQGLLAFAYLAMGAVVLYRRRRNRLALLFCGYCISAAALFGLSPAGTYDGFDRLVYWIDVWATALTPALLLHFAAACPAGPLSAPRRATAVAGYAAAALVLITHHAFAAGLLTSDAPISETQFLLDRISYALFGLGLLTSAGLFAFGSRDQNPARRQQRRWMAAGAFWGAAPFVAFYVLPFVSGRVPGPNHTLSIFALALIPASFLFAIARHRLMDVDLVVRRGTAHTLATASVLALFYAAAFAASEWVDPHANGLGPAGWVFSVVAVALLYQPMRRRIEGLLDRQYYRERYDYRQTLADFAAELAAETDSDSMLSSVRERLERTLGLASLEIFVSEGDRGFATWPEDRVVDLSELTAQERSRPEPFYFFKSPASESAALAELGLHYYVPCRARGKVVAWLGLGRTREGHYLSTEDLALLEALSGNVAIALENARLYRSLERKAEEYQRLKDYNENIVESLHVGILAVDLQGRVEGWNTQLELMFGISRSDAVGRPLGELLPETLVAECDRLDPEGGVHNLYKFELRADELPDQFRPAPESADARRERLLNVAIAPLVAKDFSPIGRLIILDDVTERSTLEEQVVQADKLSSIGLLAAGVAHEVNTPLAVISSYAQMLAKQVQGDPARERTLEKITQQTFRASEIVNSLLNFSRTASNDFADVDVNASVQETLALIEPQLQKGRVRLDLSLSEESPQVRGVHNKLQQVLLNLFLNARDAMPEGGDLKVVTECSADSASIRVSDTGVGIDREKLSRIFDPFFTTKGATGGTGLGLAVSYGIINEHGGTLRATSLEGLGTTFHIDLPLSAKPIHA